MLPIIDVKQDYFQSICCKNKFFRVLFFVFPLDSVAIWFRWRPAETTSFVFLLWGRRFDRVNIAGGIACWKSTPNYEKYFRKISGSLLEYIQNDPEKKPVDGFSGVLPEFFQGGKSPNFPSQNYEKSQLRSSSLVNF